MSEKEQSKKIDLLFETLGVWGRYQMLQMALVMSITIPACFQLYIYMYIGFQPPLRCLSVVNASSDELMNLPPNTTLDDSYKTKCAGLVDYNSNAVTTGHCDSGYDYDSNKYSTLISEWDLVCDQSYQAQLTQTVFVIGQGFGATFFTSLADRFGRRKVCLASQWIMLIVSLATTFSPSILVFTLIRFVMGAVQQGLVMSIHVIPLEVLPKSRRAMVHLISGIFWTTTLCILCGIAYGFRDLSWRHFQLTTVAGSLIALIPNMLLLDESLRWLLANGRTQEAKRIIEKASKMNGIHYDDIEKVAENCLEESLKLKASSNGLNKQMEDTQQSDREKDSANLNSANKTDVPQNNVSKEEAGVLQISINIDKDHTSQKKYTPLDIFRHAQLRKIALIMMFAWIVNAGTSFGLSLTAAKLSGQRFMNYFLVSVVSFPAGIISYITMQKIGRKITTIVSVFIAGATLLSAALIDVYLGPSGLVTGLTITGKFGISMSWGTLFQYTPELYPTNLRSAGLGIASSASRIGGMLAPFATIVIDYYPWLPGTIYGGCCILVGFLLFLLPETVDKELPQTIEEMKHWETYNKSTVN